MSLVLLRHTQPAVADGICYGRTDLDVAASFAGDADKVISAIRRPDVLVSSPLKRCRALAVRLGQAFNLPIGIDARLTEMDFGTWEGCAWAKIPRGELDLWAQDFFNARPHGGESVAMLRRRVQDALQDYRPHGQSYLLVTHAGVIKAACARGEAPEDFATPIDFGGTHELAAHKDT